MMLAIATLGSCAVPASRVETLAPPRPEASTTVAPGRLAAAAPSAAVVSTAPCSSAAVVVMLAERADRAMRDISTAGSLEEGHAAATLLTAVLRTLVPSDTDGPPDGPVAGLVTRSGATAGELDAVALGGIAAWMRPRERYDEWRAVLAAWRPDRNTMPQLSSHLLRSLGWAALITASDDLGAVRGLAAVHGLVHTGLVLDAARTAAARPQNACP